MIVSRFTTFTENFVICCKQITKIFCTRYDSANASSVRSLVILVLWQISQFRSFGKSEYKHCVYPNPHFSQKSSLCVQELYHPRAIPLCRNDTGVPVFVRDLRFYLILGVRLVHVTTLLKFQKSTGLTVLAFPHVRLTRLRDGDPSRTGLPVLAFPHVRLTQLKMSWVVR